MKKFPAFPKNLFCLYQPPTFTIGAKKSISGLHIHGFNPSESALEENKLNSRVKIDASAESESVLDNWSIEHEKAVWAHYRCYESMTHYADFNQFFLPLTTLSGKIKP